VEKDISLHGIGDKMTMWIMFGRLAESQEIHLPREYGVTENSRFLQSSLQTVKIAYTAGT
jgi:hypothetical protein